MKAFPHDYVVNVVTSPQSDVYSSAPGLPVLPSAPPPELGGPGDRWSPETLLVAAVGDCFALTFKGVAQSMHLPWGFLDCEVTGTLDRQDHFPQFTTFHLRVRLGVPFGTNEGLAHSVLEKAEHRCLIANSLKARVLVNATIERVDWPRVA